MRTVKNKKTATAERFTTAGELFTNKYGKEREKWPILGPQGEVLNIGKKGDYVPFQALAAYVKEFGLNLQSFKGALFMTAKPKQFTAAEIVAILKQFEHNTGYVFSPKAPETSAAKVSTKGAKTAEKDNTTERIDNIEKALAEILKRLK